MVINTKGVELTPPMDWIKEAGEYTLKITEWKQDGYTPSGADKFKIFFKASTGAMHSEMFSTAENMLWKIKRLEVALKAPEMYELDSLVGRYVIATVGMRAHNGSQYAEVKDWTYATQNDKLDPIPEAKDEEVAIAEEAEELF